MLHSNRAQALLKLQRWAEAEAECDSALRVDETHEKSRFRRARALMGAGKLEAARTEARSLAVRQLPPGREVQRLMEDLGLQDELPPPPAPRPPALERQDQEAQGQVGDARPSLRRRPQVPDALGLAARRAFGGVEGGGGGGGGLYADKPDADIALVDQALREREEEERARREAGDGGGGRSLMAWLGCEPRGSRRKRRACGCC